MWKPLIDGSSLPRYLALADAIDRAIDQGELKPGDRLPTHRALANHLGVTIGTITRGYQEAQRRGLITGEVGRGSFVREQPVDAFRLTWERRGEDGVDNNAIGMAQNFPVPLPRLEQQVIGPVMREIAAGDMAAMISAPWPMIMHRYQESGARWLQRYGLSASADDVLISTGFQSALWAIVVALCKPGDCILAEPLTTPGLLSIASGMQVRVHAVSADEHGIEPEALEHAIKEHDPRLVYLTPTIQTPTATLMPTERRRAIADVLNRLGDDSPALIDDDDNLPLLQSDGPPTLASLAPGSAVLVSDVSRTLGLGIRLSHVLTPARYRDAISGSLLGTTWMPAPLVAELALRLIDGGGADQIIAARRQELAVRHDLARSILDPTRLLQHDAGHHLWLKLNRDRRSDSFAAEARRAGVLINSADTFAAVRASSPNAVRVCIGAPATRAELERGLRILDDLLAREPGRERMVV
jgi:DNA-binding transcriptional MocR family regulator